jgi:hypothetical protein
MGIQTKNLKMVHEIMHLIKIASVKIYVCLYHKKYFLLRKKSDSYALIFLNVPQHDVL